MAATIRGRLAAACLILVLSVSVIGNRGIPHVTAYLLNVALTVFAVSLSLSSTASAVWAFGTLVRKRPEDGQRAPTIVAANAVVCVLAILFCWSLRTLDRRVSVQLPWDASGAARSLGQPLASSLCWWAWSPGEGSRRGQQGRLGCRAVPVGHRCRPVAS